MRKVEERRRDEIWVWEANNGKSNIENEQERIREYLDRKIEKKWEEVTGAKRQPHDLDDREGKIGRERGGDIGKKKEEETRKGGKDED